MTEPLQVGQFAIVDHEPVDRGPNAGIFHGRGPAEDRAELYIVAEGTTPAGEGFAGHVVSAVGHTWNTLDLSLTGALRRIFEEARRNLGDWNRKSIAQHRVSVGLTCFGRRGNQAVLAQAGPSVAFHLHAGRVEAYYSDEEHGQPIGSGPASPPQLTRLPFVPGDRLLLLSTAALQEIDDDLLAGILALPAAQVLPDLYQRVRHLRHLTAVLVSNEAGARAAKTAEAEPETVPEGEYVIGATGPAAPALPPGPAPETPADAGFQPSLFIDEPGEPARVHLTEVNRRSLSSVVMVPEAPVVEIPAPLRKASGDATLTRLAAEGSARLAMARATAAALAVSRSPGPTWRSEPTLNEAGGEKGRRRGRRRDSFSRGLVREEAPPRPNIIDAEPAPLVDEMAAGRRASTRYFAPSAEAIAGENAASISGGGSLVRPRASMSGRWKGGGSLSRRRGTTMGQLPPTWIVVIVGLAILLSIVGALVVPGMLREQDSQRYARLVDDAQAKLATARVQQDPAERRSALTEAQALLLEARAADPAGAQAPQLINEVAGAISAMDAVKAPAAVDTIGDLSQFGDRPVAPSRLAVADDAVYIVDNASNQVISVTLATGEKKVIYGEDKDGKRARPLAAAYLQNSDLGNRTLLILDVAKALWSYTPAAGLKQVAFAAPASLDPADIAVRGRDLFVLDAKEGAVYRFSSGDGGFGSAPVKVLSTPDLAAARRLVVDDEIITSDANGTLRRFSGQLSLVLSEAGIDRKLSAAQPPQLLGAEGDIAVADPAGDRIAVFRRDGTFDRQYRHKDFQGLIAFAVRDGVGYIFTSDGHLRRVTW